MKFCILGSKAGGSPSLIRKPSATLVKSGNDVLLLDAGEGTQFTLLEMGVQTHKISIIAISHLHGDHVLGLVGILSNFTSEKRIAPLTLIGPVGIREFVETAFRLSNVTLGYELEIRELPEYFDGEILQTKETILYASPMEHRIPCFGFRIEEIVRPNVSVEKASALGISSPEQYSVITKQGKILLGSTFVMLEQIQLPPRKPRSVVYCGDTRVCDAVVYLAKHASVMIHEATFTSVLQEKAHERYHSTAAQAAKQAVLAQVHSLVLTHISNRYFGTEELLREAQEIFPATSIAQERAWVEVPILE